MVKACAIGLLRAGKLVVQPEAGYESSNELMCTGRDLPWLQEEDEQNVWGVWGVSYRDLIAIDGDNRRLFTYSLTGFDLGEPASYQTLKTAIIEAAP